MHRGGRRARGVGEGKVDGGMELAEPGEGVGSRGIGGVWRAEDW